MRSAALLLALVACGGGDDYGGTPNGHGKLDGGGGSGVDARTIDAAPTGPDAPEQFISGKVCHTTDLRNLSACPEGLAGVKVELGTDEVTTDAHGLFSMRMQSGTGLYWRVSGPDILTTIMPLEATALLPAFNRTEYAALLTANGNATQQVGRGSLILRGTNMSMHGPQTGMTGVPISTFGPFYEGEGPTIWDGTSSGASGTIWYVDIASGQLTSVVQIPGMPGDTLFGPVMIAGETVTIYDIVH